MKKLPSTLKPRLKEGQRITVVGLGGVGEKVARYVAMFVASMDVKATLTLVDGDEFSPANSSRMVFDDFGSKAEVVGKSLLPGFVEAPIDIKVVPEYVTPANVGKLIQEGDIVMLALDNHRSRLLISNWCSTMKNVTLISAGNDGADEEHRGTYCNVQIYIRKDGEDFTESLSALHPEIADPKDKAPNEMNCMERMRSTPQILFANIAACSLMLNAFYLHLCGHLHYSEAATDIADCLTNTVIDIDDYEPAIRTP